MLSLGAVAVREGLKDQFYVELAPLEGARCIPEALAISGLSLDELEATGLPPQTSMRRFADWVADTTNNAVLISDNTSHPVVGTSAVARRHLDIGPVRLHSTVG